MNGFSPGLNRRCRTAEMVANAAIPKALGRALFNLWSVFPLKIETGGKSSCGFPALIPCQQKWARQSTAAHKCAAIDCLSWIGYFTDKPDIVFFYYFYFFCSNNS